MKRYSPTEKKDEPGKEGKKVQMGVNPWGTKSGKGESEQLLKKSN